MRPNSLAVRFVEPMAGFAGSATFTLTGIDAGCVLLSLRGVDDPSVRFVLTPAGRFFPDYRPDVTTAVASALGAAADLEVLTVLLVLTIGSGLRDATANLRAPVVLSIRDGRAVQIILDDPTHSMHQPLVPHAAASLSGTDGADRLL